MRRSLRKLIFGFTILFFFNTNANAQIQHNIKTDFNHFIQTGQDLSSSIYQSNGQAYRKLGLIAVGLAGLSFLDEPIRNFALDQHSPTRDNLFKIDRYYGNKWYMLGGLSAVYLGGLIGENEQWRQSGLQSAEAYFYTALVTVVVKELFGRARPYTDLGAYHFRPFRFTESQRSFFSGHSSTVFSVSTVMASRVDNIFWKAGWYTAALLTAGARIYNDKHWLSDVTAGALVGYAIGRFVVNQNSDQKEAPLKLSAGPSVASPFKIYLSFPIP